MSTVRYSTWASGVRESDIAEFLRLGNSPGIISLGQGVPYPDSFPVDKIAGVMESLIRNNPERIFPYGNPQGSLRVREAVVKRMNKRGVNGINPDNIVMTSGSSAAMDMIIRMIMNDGDTMIIEAPTFMGCLDSIKNWGFNLIEVPADDEGIRTDVLRDTLVRLKHDEVCPKIIYLMSNYHNPAGIMISQERRKELPAIAEEFNCFIAEDDAYSELLYDEKEDQTPIKAYDTTGNVFYLGSFSKLVAPGLRVGWAVVPDELVKTWNICRPMLDVGSPSINQEIIAELHRDDWLEGHIKTLIRGYRSRRDAMIGALETYMPDGCSWTPAHGGFYVWVTTPEQVDIDKLIETSVKNGVMYFTGKFFYLDHKNHGHFRLCFSRPYEEDIIEGVKRIATSVKEEIENL